tara:strand:- start:64465 stop:66048 length:1584 start_codon:yes stop_codon:yes gene_type:complete
LKDSLKKLIIESLKDDLEVSELLDLVEVQQSTTKHIKADYFSNIAMKLAKKLNKDPIDIADKIVAKLQSSEGLICEVAQPGYINFLIEESQKNHIIIDILDSEDLLTICKTKKPKKINVEFISANPTGPLHVGHGRGAIYGNIIAKFLQIQGHNVVKEYYVNDFGNQIKKLLESIFLCINDNQYKSDDLYQGDYIKTIATDVEKKFGKNFNKDTKKIKKYVLEKIMRLIQIPLKGLNIVFDNWFYETSLFENNLVINIINKLNESNQTVESEGAIMLKADEPRVLIKSNGEYTYFATDLAYHVQKMKNFDTVINIWGADHHGYTPRIKAGLKILGYDVKNLDIHLIQFANLYRRGKKISMSTRKGDFVELETLRKEIGNDAMNFFYLTKNKDQHLDFDLDVAVKENKNNPVYYIQYAHARIEKILNKIDGLNNYKFNPNALNHQNEKDIISQLNNFNEICKNSIIKLQPHIMANYLHKLAQDFHSYYANVKFLTEKIDYNKIYLVKAVQKVLKCGLDLLNIKAPKEM